LIGCVVVAILALISDRASWWHRAQPYLGMTILLALALVPEVISRYVGLAVIPEMMDRAIIIHSDPACPGDSRCNFYESKKRLLRPVASTLHNLRLCGVSCTLCCSLPGCSV